MFPTKTRRQQTFNTLFIVYTSHFNPVIKNETQMKFHRLMNNLKDVMSFNPKDYEVANQSNTKAFFIEYVFRGNFFSGQLECFDDEIGHVRPKKTLITWQEERDMDSLFHLLNNQSNHFFKSFFTLEMKMAALQMIYPEVVSMLACSHYAIFAEIDKLKSQIEATTPAIDKRNTEIKILKTSLASEKESNAKLTREVKDLTLDLQIKRAMVDRLNNQLEHSRNQVDAQTIRKNRLKSLKERIDRLVAASPEAARIEELEEANRHYEELIEEIPCCRVTYDSLPELKLAGKKVMTTKCGHIFTDTIIKDYVLKQHQCPVCREKLKTTDLFQLFY